MIAIVDYGAGNLRSVKRALEHLGYSCNVAADVNTIQRADTIIVPGVGNFQAIASLSANGLATALGRHIESGKPLLGICLGMQWLFQQSDEAPGITGLGAFPGTCRSLPAEVKSPHVGWNQLEICRPSRLLHGIDGFVYFTHGYSAPLVDATVAVCRYENPFSAVVERGNLFGVQFHPEKSGETGLALLENFCRC